MPWNPSIRTILVDVAPYGQMPILGHPDDGALSFFEENWAALWPKIRGNLEKMCERRAWQDDLKVPQWTARCKWMDPKVFMSDKADLFLSIKLEGYYDFFLKQTEIVHSQPD